MISIVLFFIILMFLYKALDSSKRNNVFFDSKVNIVVETNKTKRIIIEDVLESKNITISKHKNNNSLVQIETSNSYHNPFFKYITYFVSAENNLIRVESLNKFNKKKLNDYFFRNAFVDIIFTDIEKFEVSKANNNKKVIVFMIKSKDGTIVLFPSLQISK